MNAANPTIKDLADEAEFQMLAAKEHLEWFAALARAIVRDAEHNSARDVAILAGLAKYLSDTGITVTDSAIDLFGVIARGGSAPQNHKVPNRGAEVEVSQ